MDDAAPRHWLNTISLDHVRLGVEGGFTQAGHGVATRLRPLRRGDGMVFYSPRTALHEGSRLQQVTAVGWVDDDEPYRADTGHWRRRLVFEESVAPAPIRPLLPMLSFVDDLAHWGLPFRRGLFAIDAADFGVLAGAVRDAATVAQDLSAFGRHAEA